MKKSRSQRRKRSQIRKRSHYRKQSQSRKKSQRRKRSFHKMYIKKEELTKIMDDLNLFGKNYTSRDIAGIISDYTRDTEKDYYTYLPNNKKYLYRKEIYDGDNHIYSIYFYENGNKKLELSYNTDPKGIVHKEWYPNGNKKTECIYIDYNGYKIKNGKCKQWDQNGKLIYYRTFEKDNETLSSVITGFGDRLDLYEVSDNDPYNL